MAKKETKSQRATRLGLEFAALYGQEKHRLQGWQDLCSDVGVAEGVSIIKCKKVSYKWTEYYTSYC